VLHLIPAPLHRQLYRLADRGRRLWWRVRKPSRRSVFVALFDADGRVLLVRHSYGPPVWTLPGGGRARGEKPEAAAAREMREELGCRLVELQAVASHTAVDSASTDLRELFIATTPDTPRPDEREVVAIAWFDPAALPTDASGWARRAVGLAAAFRSQQR
jgi:8-oxo-dGTP pyrophosphatase MutT (NUDIX family)